MLTLTGTALLGLVTVAALAVPVAGAWWVIHRRGPGRAVTAGVTVLVVLAGQALAVGAVFLWVNRSFSFYTSWADLAGHGGGVQAVTVQGGSAAGGGRTESLVVRTPAGGTTQALVWLPRQYDEAAYARKRFPVVVLFPGQPSTPNAFFRHFDVGTIASRAIDAGKVPPFVAVIPPLMTNPPRDTECTDVPGGPRAETFLASDVPAAVRTHLRVLPQGRAWSIGGWSTGAFCAAKIGLAQPTRWGSVISFGGYYQPVTDSTTGDLFHGQRHLKQDNSPIALYRRHGSAPLPMLLIAGRQDHQTWGPTSRFLALAKGDPRVAYIDFPTGGHNFRNYRAYLAPALEWAKLPAPA